MWRYALALLVASSALAQSPAKVDSLAWMAGTWVEERGGNTVAESRLGPRNGLMVATNLSAYASGRTSYEFLRIAETADGFSYFASPGGRPPTEFTLKELGTQSVVFERADDSFPKRVIYRREGEVLVARIEGMMKGEPRAQEWRFVRR